MNAGFTSLENQKTHRFLRVVFLAVAAASFTVLGAASVPSWAAVALSLIGSTSVIGYMMSNYQLAKIAAGGEIIKGNETTAEKAKKYAKALLFG